MSSRYIKDVIIAKEVILEAEGVDVDTLYRICRILDEGVIAWTDKLNKLYKTDYPCTPADFIGMTQEEYGKQL